MLVMNFAILFETHSSFMFSTMKNYIISSLILWVDLQRWLNINDT